MLFSLATVVIWVVISLITSQRKLGISPELQKLAQPLTPTLNQETLRQVEQKRFYSEGELSRFPIYKIISSPDGASELVVTIDTDTQTLFPSSSPVPSPSPSPSPEAVTEATTSGTATVPPVSTQSGVTN